MVLCCCQWPEPQPQHSPVPEIKVGSNQYHPASNYPGSRPNKYYATGGNALSGHPPLGVTNNNHDPFSPAQSIAQHRDLVAVTVPPGVSAGQTIRVLLPDGSGRQIEAQVPSGMSVGSTFYVQSASRVGASSSVVDTSAIDVPVHSSNEPMANAHTLGDYSDVPPVSPQSSPPPATAPPPFSECLDNPAPPNCGQQFRSDSSKLRQTGYSSSHNCLKSAAPPGAAPGSTIHVQAQRENHAAHVPPNCSELHVEYPPRPAAPVPPTSYNNKQKLLLVRAPPGIAPGTKLYIKIPDEPGRILSAEVPPGNVREFHVAYEPLLYPSHSHSASQTHQPLYQHYESSNNRLANNKNNSSNGGNAGGDANWLLPVVGGFAAGVASTMVIDHFAHNDV